MARTDYNRPFPSSKKFHFQNEAKRETFVVEMSFNYDANKTHFHNKGFALSLVLKVKLFGTRKWPITFKAIHGQALVYPQELISKREEGSYNLRWCAMGIMLQSPRTLTRKTLGDRAFLAAAPKLWNGLPSQIRMSPIFIGLKVYLRPIFLD